jgi:hypothetical protein
MPLKRWLQTKDYDFREAFFDWLHKVETRKKIPFHRLTFSGDNAGASAGYEASDDCVARDILSAFAIDYSQYTFIDIGSGKGKVLFLASRHPFKKIIGVEFAAELHEAAVDNIASYRSRGPMPCRDLESIHQDATTYVFPAGPLFLYFFNPASEEIVRHVLTNLDKAFADSHRDIIIGYYNAKYAHLFALFPSFKLAYKSQFFDAYRAGQP